MPSEPRRTTILNAIVTKLQLIIAGATYNYTVGEVNINLINLDQIPNDKFPYICLQVGRADYTPLTQNEYTSGQSFDDLNGWLIGVIGYIKIDSAAGTFVQQTEKFHQDIITALQTDPQLGLSSYVINTYLETIWDPIPSLGDDGEVDAAAVNLIFKVKYDFTKTAP